MLIDTSSTTVQRHCHIGLRIGLYGHISTIRPNLCRLLGIPSPGEDIITGREILGNEDVICDEPDDPITRARAHAVPMAARSRAVEHSCVPRAGSREREATWMSLGIRARACGGVVEACIGVLDPWHRIAGPSRAFWPCALIHKDGLRDRPAEGPVGRAWCLAVGAGDVLRVPDQGLLGAVKLEGHFLEAFFGESLLGGAEPVLVSTAVIIERAPSHFDRGASDPLSLLDGRGEVGAEVTHLGKFVFCEDGVATDVLSGELPTCLTARIDHWGVTRSSPRIKAVRIFLRVLRGTHVHGPGMLGEGGVHHRLWGSLGIECGVAITSAESNLPVIWGRPRRMGSPCRVDFRHAFVAADAAALIPPEASLAV